MAKETKNQQLENNIAVDNACRQIRDMLKGKASLGGVSAALRAVPEELLEVVAMATRQPMDRITRLRGLGDQMVPG